MLVISYEIEWKNSKTLLNSIFQKECKRFSQRFQNYTRSKESSANQVKKEVECWEWMKLLTRFEIPFYQLIQLTHLSRSLSGWTWISSFMKKKCVEFEMWDIAAHRTSTRSDEEKDERKKEEGNSKRTENWSVWAAALWFRRDNFQTFDIKWIWEEESEEFTRAATSI